MPTMEYLDGTEAGRICMSASAKRFQAVMAQVPDDLLSLRATSNWDGRFFNWNDDYTGMGHNGDDAPRLWAWETHLIKWISQTNIDGSCELPTLDMLERVAVDCLETASRNRGEIQGCEVY